MLYQKNFLVIILILNMKNILCWTWKTRVFRDMMNRMNRKRESFETWWIAWIEKESLASHHESYESKTRVLRVIMFCMTRLTSHDKSWWLDLTRPSLCLHLSGNIISQHCSLKTLQQDTLATQLCRLGLNLCTDQN